MIKIYCAQKKICARIEIFSQIHGNLQEELQTICLSPSKRVFLYCPVCPGICNCRVENLARQLNLICVVISSSLGDAGLNTLIVCNNMQATNHKELMRTQKDHRHL